MEDLQPGEVEENTQVISEIVAQGQRISDGEWETLGSDFANGTRALWWAEHATKGYYGAYRTARITETIVTETEALILIGGK